MAANAATNFHGLRRTTSPHRKRLSLNLPVHSSTFTFPNTPPSPVDHPESLAESTAYLTALAAQERLVLELKEELEKAESELTKLKRQWAIQESTRQRHELLQNEMMRAGTDVEAGEVRGITSPTSEERQSRRRAAMAKLTQMSTRSVTSQRHHRALSLLSPDRLKPPPNLIDLRDHDADVVDAAAKASAAPVLVPSPTPLRRADTIPTRRPVSMIETSSLKRQSQDVLLRTGKQMAEGFKEGLWAFVEDLKQATVGDDTRPHSPASVVRRQGSRASLRSTNSRRERALGNETTDLTDHHEYGPWKKPSPIDGVAPSARWSTSTTLSEMGQTSLTHSRSSTPRTSTRYKIFGYLLSMLRPANIYHQLGPILHLRSSATRSTASTLGLCHVGLHTV